MSSYLEGGSGEKTKAEGSIAKKPRVTRGRKGFEGAYRGTLSPNKGFQGLLCDSLVPPAALRPTATTFVLWEHGVGRVLVRKV